MRPDVVWFGEMPYGMDAIEAALAAAELFVAVGTSGAVYPAAGFVAEARALGIRTVELNLEPRTTPASSTSPLRPGDRDGAGVRGAAAGRLDACSVNGGSTA